MLFSVWAVGAVVCIALATFGVSLARATLTTPAVSPISHHDVEQQLAAATPAGTALLTPTRGPRQRRSTTRDPQTNPATTGPGASGSRRRRRRARHPGAMTVARRVAVPDAAPAGRRRVRAVRPVMAPAPARRAPARGPPTAEARGREATVRVVTTAAHPARGVRGRRRRAPPRPRRPPPRAPSRWSVAPSSSTAPARPPPRAPAPRRGSTSTPTRPAPAATIDVRFRRDDPSHRSELKASCSGGVPTVIDQRED